MRLRIKCNFGCLNLKLIKTLKSLVIFVNLTWVKGKLKLLYQ